MQSSMNGSSPCVQWPLDENWVIKHIRNETGLVDELRCLCLNYIMPYEKFRFVVDVLIVCPLSIVGILGNSLSVIVLRRDSSINYATSLLLGSIAVIDNVYLVSCLLYQTTKAICYYGHSMSRNNETIISETLCSPALLDAYPYIERTALAMANVAMTTVTWLVVVVALGRYCAICRPLDSLRLGTSKRARTVLIGVAILAILYNIPAYFEHAVKLEPDWCRSRHQKALVYTKLRENPWYFVIYKSFIYLVFRFLLPLATLVILNGRLLVTLRRQQTTHVEQRRFSTSVDKYYGVGRRSRHSKVAEAVASRRRRHECLRLRRFSRADDPSVTALVVGMVTLFIVCQLPDLIVRLYETAGQVRVILETITTTTSNDTTITASEMMTSPYALYDSATSQYARIGMNGTVGGDDFIDSSFGYSTTAESTTQSATTPNQTVGDENDDENEGNALAVEYWTTVTNALLTLNSSANCFVYCFSGHRFRQHLRLLLCPKRTTNARTTADRHHHAIRTRRRAAVVIHSTDGDVLCHNDSRSCAMTSRDEDDDENAAVSSKSAVLNGFTTIAMYRPRPSLKDSMRSSYSFSGTSTKSVTAEQ